VTWGNMGLSRFRISGGRFEQCENAVPSCLILTGVIDGPLTGGQPKAVELYVCGHLLNQSGRPAPSSCKRHLSMQSRSARASDEV
jgi:hypothetical protein